MLHPRSRRTTAIKRLRDHFAYNGHTMKLLLTSNGLNVPAVAEALTGLVGKPPAGTKIAVITTAESPEPGDKSWLVNDLRRVKDQGYGFLDILDFAAIPRSVWQPRLEAADILFFFGGNPYHLLDCMRRSGLVDLLPELLKSRVYAGISAGSSVTGPSLSLSSEKDYYPEGISAQDEVPALGLVPFLVRSHLNNPKFPLVREDRLREQTKHLKWPAYVLDDYTALKITDKDVYVVGTGKHLYLDQN